MLHTWKILSIRYWLYSLVTCDEFIWFKEIELLQRMHMFTIYDMETVIKCRVSIINLWVKNSRYAMYHLLLVGQTISIHETRIVESCGIHRALDHQLYLYQEIQYVEPVVALWSQLSVSAFSSIACKTGCFITKAVCLLQTVGVIIRTRSVHC